MGYSQQNGYVPTEIETIMASIMDNVNAQFGTTYTAQTFVGTSAYKYFYALAQKFQENEVKTSEIFEKLQVYFDQINARISRPVVTNPGIVEKLLDEGYTASVKPMILADAGKINICINVNDGDHAAGLVTITSYANLVAVTPDTVSVNGTAFTAQAGAATPGAATFQAATSNSATATSLAAQINAHATVSLVVRARAEGAKVYLRAVHGGTAGNSIALAYADLGTATVGATVSGAALSGGTANAEYADLKTELCELISVITVAGGVTQGSESEAVVLSNGQSLDFKYHLPNKIPVHLKLTITLSENNQVIIGDPDDTKQILLDNINARYKLGRNFEPQRYFSVLDAPWASQVQLQYSFDYDAGDPGSAVYYTAVYDSAFDDLLVIGLADIYLVEV